MQSDLSIEGRMIGEKLKHHSLIYKSWLAIVQSLLLPSKIYTFQKKKNSFELIYR